MIECTQIIRKHFSSLAVYFTYRSTQWAAVRILVGLIKDPPHSTISLNLSATYERWIQIEYFETQIQIRQWTTYNKRPRILESFASANDSDNLPLREWSRSSAAIQLELGSIKQSPAIVFDVGRINDVLQLIGRGIQPTIKNIQWPLLVIHQQAGHHVLPGRARTGNVIPCTKSQNVECSSI